MPKKKVEIIKCKTCNSTFSNGAALGVHLNTGSCGKFKNSKKK